MLTRAMKLGNLAAGEWRSWSVGSYENKEVRNENESAEVFMFY